MKTIKDLKIEVTTARAEAIRQARSNTVGCRYFPSRGTFLATSYRNGQCEPQPEGEAVEWRGTKREIDQLIAKVEAGYPNVTQIYIAISHDAAESMYAFNVLSDYVPYAGCAEVVVWERPVAA